MKNTAPKVAIVHDWLIGGGAELVVEELHKMYPQAPIYTSYCTDVWRKRLDNKVITGYLQHWPFSRLRKFLPVLRIWWFTHLDLSEYDLVISSSGNGEAKGVRVPSTTTHICYCYTPTHFYWRHYDYYLRNPGFGPLGSVGLRLLVGPLRRWDRKAAQRPDFFIGDSSQIVSDINEYYKRDAEVIFPPVDTKRFQALPSVKRQGFVTIGRQVPYKRIDIIVAACTKLGVPLTVIGKGPQHQKLVAMAGPTVTFIEHAPDKVVMEAMASAEAFIQAANEDFGITPVEAMAAGTPVIAYQAGGALDYVIEGITGMFFKDQTVASLTAALKKFDAKAYKPDVIKKSTENFNQATFIKRMTAFIEEKLAPPKSKE